MNERIKKLRKELDLTQQEFADRIGVKRNTIATYEIGRNTPLDAVVASICKEFNVNETWLRTGDGEMFAKKDREGEITQMVQKLLSGETSEFKARMISVLAGLKEEQWLVLEEKMKEIIGSRANPPAEPQPAPWQQVEVSTELDLSAKLAELERQNKAMAARIAAMEEEDAILDAAERSSQSRETGTGAGMSKLA